MNWYLFFYLLSIVNNICTFCIVGGIIATMWSFIGLIVDLSGGDIGEFISKDSSSLKIPSDMTKYLHLSTQKEIEELKADSTVNK